MILHFEFLGGPYDGQFFCTDSKDVNEAEVAEGFAALTDGGLVGKRFAAISPAALRSLARKEIRSGADVHTHIYEVEDRLEDARTALVRARYQGVREG